MRNKASYLNLALFLVFSLFLAGCAPLLIAGGAVGGYAIAKNANDDSGSSAKRKP